MTRPARTRKSAGGPAQAAGGGVARLMVRVAFGPHGALGPGKLRLLELIDRHGSISAAARAMGVSYRRAWLLVEGVQRGFREKVVAARHGGTRGGGAGLTPFGRGLVRRYRAIEAAARAAVDGELRALERDIAPAPARAPRSRARKAAD